MQLLDRSAQLVVSWGSGLPRVWCSQLYHGRTLGLSVRQWAPIHSNSAPCSPFIIAQDGYMDIIALYGHNCLTSTQAWATWWTSSKTVSKTTSETSAGLLKSWHVQILKSWNLEILKSWNLEILKSWNLNGTDELARYIKLVVSSFGNPLSLQ